MEYAQTEAIRCGKNMSFTNVKSNPINQCRQLAQEPWFVARSKNNLMNKHFLLSQLRQRQLRLGWTAEAQVIVVVVVWELNALYEPCVGGDAVVCVGVGENPPVE